MSMTVIQSVDPRSPAHRAGLRVGETLTHINGHQIVDVLDYKFFSYDTRLELVLREEDGSTRTVRLAQAGGGGPGAGVPDLFDGPGPLLRQQLHLLLCGPDAPGDAAQPVF